MPLKKSLLLAVVLVACAVGRVEASTGAVVDQSFLVGPTGSSALADGYAFAAQTVRAGMTGYLVRVELNAARRSDFLDPWLLDIESLSGTIPSGTILSSTLIPAQNFPVSIPLLATPLPLAVNLSQYVFFHAGDSFAIVLHPQGVVGRPALAAGFWSSSSGYSGGAEFAATDGQDFFEEPFDLNFRTWVNPIPEPSSILLATLGLVAFAVQGWRRRRA